MSSNGLQGREVIFELASFGAITKVSAVDTKTLTEVSIQGPASAGEAILKRNALKRLEYVLRKNNIIS